METQGGPDAYEDPGWTRAMPGPFMPWRKQTDGLLTLRGIYSSLFYAGFLILYVLSAIDPGMGRVSYPLAAGVVFMGLAGIAAAHWSTRRPLNTGSSRHLAASYRESFFLGFALNEAPLMMSFVLVFIRDEMWPYLLALPFWVIGMVVLAPGKANLRRRQQQIMAQGSMLQLVPALRETPLQSLTRNSG